MLIKNDYFNYVNIIIKIILNMIYFYIKFNIVKNIHYSYNIKYYPILFMLINN